MTAHLPFPRILGLHVAFPDSVVQAFAAHGRNTVLELHAMQSLPSMPWRQESLCRPNVQLRDTAQENTVGSQSRRIVQANLAVSRRRPSWARTFCTLSVGHAKGCRNSAGIAEHVTRFLHRTIASVRSRSSSEQSVQLSHASAACRPKCPA